MNTTEQVSFAIFHARDGEAMTRPSAERWLLGNASNYQLVALVEAPSQGEAFHLTSYLSEVPWWRNPRILIWQPGRLSLVRDPSHLKGLSALDQTSTQSAHAQKAIPRTFAFPEDMVLGELSPRFTTIGDVLVSRETHQAWLVMPTGLQEIPYSPSDPHISLSVGDAVTAVAFSPGGHLLAVGTRNGFITGWNLAKEELVFRYQLGDRSIDWIHWSSNGAQLAAGSQNWWAGIWGSDEKDNLSVELFRRTDPLYSSCWLRQEPAFVSRPTTPRDELWLARLNARNLPDVLWRYRASSFWLDGLDEAVVSPDGASLALLGDDPSPRLWQASTGTSSSLAAPGLLAHALTWSPDGTAICAITGPSPVVAWRAVDGMLQARCAPSLYTDVRSAICAVAWSPNGRVLATAQTDGTAQLFSAQSGDHLFTYHGLEPRALAVGWSPDGMHIVVGSESGSAAVLNIPEKIIGGA